VDFTLSEFERELLDLGRGYAEGEIAAVAARAWHEERCPTELLRGLGELGLLGTLVPEKWGGIGSSTVGYVALLEALAAVDPSVAAAWQAHCTIGSLPLLLFGDDDQRELRGDPGPEVRVVAWQRSEGLFQQLYLLVVGVDDAEIAHRPGAQGCHGQSIWVPDRPGQRRGPGKVRVGLGLVARAALCLGQSDQCVTEGGLFGVA